MNVQSPGKVLEPVACNDKIRKINVVYKKHLPVNYKPFLTPLTKKIEKGISKNNFRDSNSSDSEKHVM